MRSDERHRKRSRSRRRRSRTPPSSSSRRQPQRRRSPSPSRSSHRRSHRSRSRSYSASPHRRHHSRSRSRHSRERHSSSSRRDRRSHSRTPSRDRHDRRRESSRDRERERARGRRSDSRERSSRRRSASHDRSRHRSGTKDRERSYEATRRQDRSQSSYRENERRTRSSSSPSPRRRRGDDEDDDGRSSSRGGRERERQRDRDDARRSREKSDERRSEKRQFSVPQATGHDLSKSHEREEVNESKRSAAATEINSEQESKPSEKPAEDASSARVDLPSLASLSSTAASRQRSSDETANSKPTAVSFTSTLVRQGRSRGSSDVGELAAISISTSGNSRSGTPHQHSGAKSGSMPVARPSPAASLLAPEAKSNGPYASTALPLLDPAMEKLRETRRESWRAHLKSTSEFNRAEMKVLALEADLEIAEFWLEMMTANLEDVGKRIEIHDWNYQKAREQQELE